jgi:archaellum component FlaF (FlaF/FlaG flagellin family)
MGFSVTLTHIIMVIAAVILASTFAASAFYTGNIVQNELNQGVSDTKNMVDLQLDIVYATVDNSTSPPHFIIYAKNTGNLPVTDFTFLDTYVGEYGKAQYFQYSGAATTGSGTFKVTDSNGDGVWDPRETAIIFAYPTTTISGAIYEAKLVPSKGIGSDYLFSASVF